MNTSDEYSDFLRYGDERSRDWFLMQSPIYLAVVLGVYLTVIYRIGPELMKNRQPFNLKWILGIYNLLQVLACCYLIKGIVNAQSNSLMFWKCNAIDYGYNKQALETLRYTYLTFLLKIVELIETVFFVLRKKNQQVSNLHVYHHTSTALLAWIMVKYYGGGMILFSIILNSCVHVIMYTYYFLAVFGKTVQQKLLIIKKSITLIQMIQFCFILTQCLIGLSCDVPKALIALYAPNVILIFYMFYGFFQYAYAQKKNKLQQN